MNEPTSIDPICELGSRVLFNGLAVTGFRLVSLKWRRSMAIVLALVTALTIEHSASQELTWFEAIRTSDTATVRRLLNDGHDPNNEVDTPEGRLRPLTLAIVDREQEIAIVLLESGAQVDGIDGVDLLTEAASRGLVAVLEFVLTERPQLFSDPVIGVKRHGLRQSAVTGYLDVVDLLLNTASTLDDPFTMDQLGEATNVALAQGHDDIGRRLIEMSGVSYLGTLSVASATSSPGIIHELLRRGADLGEQFHRESGRFVSPLEIAQMRREGARSREDQQIARCVIQELLDAGGQVSGQLAPRAEGCGRELMAMLTTDPWDVLMEGARIGYYDVVNGFLDLRMTLPDDEVHAALHSAVLIALRENHNDIARLLLHSGVNPGGGLLHAATRFSSPGMVRYLLSLGADPMEMVEGKVPLDDWLERVEREDALLSPLILHELVVGGADACWLIEHEDRINLSVFVLRNSATECWSESTTDP